MDIAYLVVLTVMGYRVSNVVIVGKRNPGWFVSLMHLANFHKMNNACMHFYLSSLGRKVLFRKAGGGA